MLEEPVLINFDFLFGYFAMCTSGHQMVFSRAPLISSIVVSVHVYLWGVYFKLLFFLQVFSVCGLDD